MQLKKDVLERLSLVSNQLKELDAMASSEELTMPPEYHAAIKMLQGWIEFHLDLQKMSLELNSRLQDMNDRLDRLESEN